MLLKVFIEFALGLSAIGLGTPLLNVLAPAERGPAQPSLGISGLAGLFVAASLSIVLNFFVPIGPLVAISIFVIGLALFLPFASKFAWRQWITYLALVVAITPLAVFLPEGYDGGLYHLPHQYWLVTNKIVLGLANLHGPLGLDSLNEPLLALGWLGGKDLAAVPLIAGLFGLFFLLTIVEETNDADGDPVLLYIRCMFGAGVLWTYIETFAMGWTSTDLPTAIALATCAYCGFAAIAKDSRGFLVLSFFFAAFAAALKLSGLFAFLFPLGLTVDRILRRGWREVPLQEIVLVAVLFLPIIARNVFVSGCLAYPASLTCLPVPWQAGEIAEVHATWIKAWARVPNSGLEHASGWAWLPIWFEANQGFLLRLAAIAVAGLVLAVAVAGDRSDRRVPLAPIIIYSAYTFAALIFWFLAAPDPRFGIGYFMFLATLPGLWLLASGKRYGIWFPTGWVPPTVLVLSLVVALGYSWKHAVRAERTLFVYNAVHLPEIETTTVGTVRRPVNGDRCFLTPPPCSPYGADTEDSFGPYRAFLPLR